MACSTLQSFLEGDLPAELQAELKLHVAGCPACQEFQEEIEAALHLYQLGAELARRPDRPRAVIPDPDVSFYRTASGRRWLRSLGAAGALAALVLAVVLLGPGRASETVDQEIVASLLPRRTFEERLPGSAFDRYRVYDQTRSREVRRETISQQLLAKLETLPDKTRLVSAHLASENLEAAEQLLGDAGPGDDLDVARAIVASRRSRHPAALASLDEVLERTPHHAQALWNRAIVLEEVGLPLVAAEAFEASFAVFEPGWNGEAIGRVAALRSAQAVRARDWASASRACHGLAGGEIPDLAIVRRHASVCRPALLEAVRQALTRDEVMYLLPVAQVIDAESGGTAGVDLVERIARADFRIRGDAVKLYRQLTTTRDLASDAKARLLDQLRAFKQDDLVLGAISRGGMMRDHVSEYVKLARDSGDPYFGELAVEREAEAKLDSGRPLEAELSLREAVAGCAARDVEQRCAYLQLALIKLYLARHLPVEATNTALGALQRTKRLGLYWHERLLFDLLATAARQMRDNALMRAYVREAALRDGECDQLRMSHEIVADVELTALRHARARAELERAPMCGEPPSLLRAEIEADLARFDGTPERTAALRSGIAEARQSRGLGLGMLAGFDASEGRLVAASDPTAARALLWRAIDLADKLGIADVAGVRARGHAYTTLLMLGAWDQRPDHQLEMFAAAGRTQLRAGCVLALLVDGKRLLAIARDAAGEVHRVFNPQALRSPDFDADTLVPRELVRALAGCTRVDVIALPPLYGLPRLLPAELAWSYRGPGRAPAAGSRRPTAVIIDDVRPPASLGLAKLRTSSSQPRGSHVDVLPVTAEQATPRRVRKEFEQADFVEIHAHGFVDLGISDVSLIALSPEADGTFALTARTIASLELSRAPFIVLAACHAAYTAPYLHEPWSLPYAFLLAGARGVLAPATAIPDREASEFFRMVGDQILGGADPATVLREQRLLRHTDTERWVDDVILFD